MTQTGLRLDGKLKKGFRFKDGKIIKSKAKICRENVSKKIGKNINEFKNKRFFVNKKQAIAVGFKMTIKKYPECKKFLKKKTS